MPRTAREKSNTGIYHIILRGINRQTIFNDNEDKERFLYTLKKYKENSGYKIYGYCLMGNHLHLLIKEGAEALSIFMRRIGASYVYWYNWKYERTGSLFQDRYKSEVVEDEKYLLTVIRYIHQNPVKAGLVKHIEQYQWSSYLEYVSLNKLENRIVDRDFILDIFNSDRRKAISLFKRFQEKSNNDICMDVYTKKRIKDDVAIEIIKSTCNLAYCSDLQKFEAVERDRLLRMIKQKGLSTRQIARLTGISRTLVLKA